MFDNDKFDDEAQSRFDNNENPKPDKNRDERDISKASELIMRTIFGGGPAMPKDEKDAILKDIKKERARIRGSVDGLVIPKKIHELEQGSDEEKGVLKMLTLLFGYNIMMGFTSPLGMILMEAMKASSILDSSIKSYYDGTYKISIDKDGLSYWEGYYDGSYHEIEVLPHVKL